MKLEGDSSLHFVSLRMTDTCVFVIFKFVRNTVVNPAIKSGSYLNKNNQIC